MSNADTIEILFPASWSILQCDMWATQRNLAWWTGFHIGFRNGRYELWAYLSRPTPAVSYPPVSA
jgi:hypothetical protein